MQMSCQLSQYIEISIAFKYFVTPRNGIKLASGKGWLKALILSS